MERYAPAPMASASVWYARTGPAPGYSWRAEDRKAELARHLRQHNVDLPQACGSQGDGIVDRVADVLLVDDGAAAVPDLKDGVPELMACVTSTTAWVAVIDKKYLSPSLTLSSAVALKEKSSERETTVIWLGSRVLVLSQPARAIVATTASAGSFRS